MRRRRPDRRPGLLTALAAACRDRAAAALRLPQPRRHRQRPRDVEPHRLVHTGRRWYLVAWDLDRQDWRTFRVDRIDPRTPTGPRFTPRDARRTPTQPATSRGRSPPSAYRYQARFTLHASAETAAERIAAHRRALEPIDEHTCILHAGSNSLDELAIYVTP